MATKIGGGCSCGSLRYQLKDNPVFVHACHCSLCKQQTGSAFIAHAFIESFNFEVTKGTLNYFEGATGSGNPHEVGRCDNCSVAIISFYRGQRLRGVVKVGTLDEPEKFPPKVHAHVNNKVPWIEIPKDIPAFEGNYDFEKTWPKESFQRWTKAI